MSGNLGFFCSQIAWTYLIAILSVIVFFVPNFQVISPIVARDRYYIDYEKDPIYFIQLSDTHVSSTDPKTQETFENLLKISQFFHSDTLVITGDLVDNCENTKRPRYCDQNEADYKAYRKILDKYSSDYECIVDIPGNHDMYGVYNPKDSFYSKYSVLMNELNENNQTYDFGIIQKKCVFSNKASKKIPAQNSNINKNIFSRNSFTTHHKINIQNSSIILQNDIRNINQNTNSFHMNENKPKLMDKIQTFNVNNDINGNEEISLNFLILNPFSFPAGHPTTIYWSHPSDSYADQVTEAVQKSKKNETLVVLCHFPISMIFNERIDDALSSESVAVTLTGHLHRKKVNSYHYGDSIEFNSPSYHINKITIVAIDNGRVTYHERDFSSITTEINVIVTSPVPYESTTPFSGQNSNNRKIRALVFVKDIQNENEEKEIIDNINIQVKGDVSGKLEFEKKIKNNVFLFSMPFELRKVDNINEKCKYQIEFYGDYHSNLTFYVGKTLSGLVELIDNEYEMFAAGFLALSFLFPILVFISFPWNFAIVSDSFEYKCPGYTVLGFLVIRKRLHHLHQNFRLVLFSFVVWPIFLPLMLIEIDGHSGALFSYGYYCGNKFVYSEWGQIYCLFYYLGCILPIVIFASAFAVKKLSIYEWILLIIGFTFSFYSLFRYVVETAGWVRMWFSVFIIVPPTLIFILYHTKNQTNNDNYSNLPDRNRLNFIQNEIEDEEESSILETNDL
ncbi:hypothetical protein TRFO_03800 [Tritrichomonas foetus]|uniref:Calcineurin-like phosphoesterase domain-containing protein n=1 Tax=Tritrichomonas foetus TaxID=1144522 RepID=A0A1J4KLG2_9EUKA|nr:hypothetical protein TRFO_03800 [Tritrichomonas foetus]|eukprot:OHT12143.1 hypothetical protein TRFO_03800 [Tritrichomonas foetus]